MGFWDTSTGENAAVEAVEKYKEGYSVGGGSFELIPDGTFALAHVEGVQWEQNDRGAMEEYINVKWKLEGPAEVAGRVTFQKLWVKDPEPNALKKGQAEADKKRDKALTMLGVIDAFAGGKLARKATIPTDDDLALALINKPMVIELRIWEIGGNSGNFVASVNPKTTKQVLGKDAPPKKQETAASGGGFNDLDDGIPF